MLAYTALLISKLEKPMKLTSLQNNFIFTGLLLLWIMSTDGTNNGSIGTILTPALPERNRYSTILRS